MKPEGRSIAVGLGIPTVCVIAGTLILGSSRTIVLGFPLVVFWMFCCFVITAICLSICWIVFDRKPLLAFEELDEVPELPAGAEH